MDAPVIPDEEYDALAKEILEEYDAITHPHKHLISKEDLKAGTMYSLAARHYPKIVVSGAETINQVGLKRFMEGPPYEV